MTGGWKGWREIDLAIINLDGFVKSRNCLKFVIPVKAGIQLNQAVLGSPLRGIDGFSDFLRNHQSSCKEPKKRDRTPQLMNRDAFCPAGNNEKLLQRRFQGLAGCEFGNFLSRDLDLFARLGVPAYPCFSLAHAESSKAN
jgi:hypothetical protein